MQNYTKLKICDTRDVRYFIKVIVATIIFN